MYTSAPVRLAGVKIGIVDKIYLEHRKAVVQMMIDNKYKLLDDARVVISTIGFIGEKYVEIVYKDEFKTENPKYHPSRRARSRSSSPSTWKASRPNSTKFTRAR